MYSREQLYSLRSLKPVENLTIRIINAAHGAAAFASHRISKTLPSDVWLKGFIKPIRVSSDDDWDSLKCAIRDDSTEGHDVRQACANGAIPVAISYKWQSREPGLRMSDVQFENLRYTVMFHLGTGDMRNAEVTFWLDQHMRKHVGDRERIDWMSYGTTAYRNSIVCYLPNADVTHGNKNPYILTNSEPANVWREFETDTARLWIAFELRRATQGVGLMCGSHTEFGMCKNLVLDGPKTMIDMWDTGFITGGRLSNAEAERMEKGDIMSGRLLGINDSWDEFLNAERDKIKAEGFAVSEVPRSPHMTEAGTFDFSGGGEYENHEGLSAISVCDIGPGQHSTSSYLVARQLPVDADWMEGGLLIAGDFPDEEKRKEVARVPLRMIGVDTMGHADEIHYLWVGHVSTKNAEKYCCVVIGLRRREEFSVRVVDIIDIWPINSDVYDAALHGSREGARAVISHLDTLRIGNKFWWYVSFPPYVSAMASEIMERATFERLMDD